MITRMGAVMPMLYACCLLVATTRADAQDAPAPPAAATRGDFVLVDTSERAFTVFRTVPADMARDAPPQVEKERHVVLLTWPEWERKSDDYISSTVLKNEYPASRVGEGVRRLLEKYPGAPFGLTWNGGVAFTQNDFEHARRTHAAYKKDPAEYERSRGRDPLADPVNPESHFGALLGTLDGEGPRSELDSPATAGSGDLMPNTDVAHGEPRRITSDVKPPELLRKVAPEYPPNAKKRERGEDVILECIVDEEGKVTVVRVLSPDGPLTTAAVEAVRQWQYKPAEYRGRPQAVFVIVKLHFSP